MLEQLQCCTKRRMILSIIILGVLTVLLLIFEDALTAQVEHKPTPSSISSSSGKPSISVHDEDFDQVGALKIPLVPSVQASKQAAEENLQPCWLKESFTVERPCSPCSDFEVISKSAPACAKTGLKEVVRCSASGLYSRSCSSIPDLEKRRFLVFESLMLLVSILSYGFVKLRTSQLERIASKQIEKRLAAGL